MGKRILHIDFETYCDLDIRKVGLDNYVKHPTFTVTVVAWAFDDEPVHSLKWPINALPDSIHHHIINGGEIRAHNAQFEDAVITTHYGLSLNVGQTVCTMQKALAYGLPAGLLKAGRALNLKIIKDETKRLLMLQMGRPRPGAVAWHVSDPVKLAHLAAYCEDDVRAERALDEACPDLHPWEKTLSELDGKINRKGVRLDWGAVEALRGAAVIALNQIDAECAALTGGEVTKPGSQTQKLLAWLQANMLFQMSAVDKEAIAEVLAQKMIPAKVRRVLELRQMAARSSVAKLDRMLDVMSSDNRARYLLQFAGAGRTLRWAGRLVQPQNLPRVGDINAGQVIAAAQRDPGALGLLWGDALGAISRSLRSCFIAKANHVLVSVDLSQIEARVLAWLAGQADVLQAFERGEDVYVLAAKKVGSSDRSLGKVLTLACGFGMGWMKFRETAAAAPYHINLSAGEARNHLRAWRDTNGAIVGLWGEVERVVRLSIENPDVIFDLPRTMRVRTRNGVTQIRKPNGVKLSYHNMRLWGGDLIFDGVNSTTKNWGIEKAYGGRLVENWVQSVARDVMAEIMMRAFLKAGLVPVMTVHDEIVWEIGDDQHQDARIWVVEPAWAPGLPVEAKLHVGFRYAK